MKQSLFYHSFRFATVTYENEKRSGYPLGSPYHFIARMKSGTGVIRGENGKELHLQAGDVFYLPLGLAYRSHWSPDKERGLPVSWESYAFSHWPDVAPPCYPMQRLAASAEATALLDRLAQTQDITPTSVGILYLLLGEVLPVMSRKATDTRQELLQRATEFIAKKPSFHVSDLAKHLKMSESALFFFFREVAHTTPIGLKQQILAERAMRLLSDTDRTVEEITAALGFCSAAHLRKTLRSVTGKTPSEIRREAKFM